MKSIRVFLCAYSVFACVSLFAAGKADAVLSIDAKASGTPVSPELFGVFFEDINFAADGGLYPEMLRNRSFEMGWGASAWRRLGEGTTINILEEGPLNANNPHFARISVSEAGEGIGNEGYDGMSLHKGDAFAVSAWIRSKDPSMKSLSITLEDERDGSVFARTEFAGFGREWRRFESRLACWDGSEFGMLKILAKSKGSFDIDMVSIYPERTFMGRKNGLREDIARKIADLKPGFIRFPGGCIVEGQTMGTAYRWKDTIGDIAERDENPNLWGYWQSYGLGFFEYFQFARDIGAEPLPVLNCGMACQARGGDLASMEELGAYIQDALDLIEYANGGADTRWGAVRARNGSAEPFNMKYLAIGNEQWGSEYYIRYAKFSEAIRAKHPEIQLIFASGPSPSGGLFDDAWRQTKTLKPDLVDEHYYMSPEWFLANTKRYDGYDRNGPKVFAGEYAAHNERRTNNLFSALAEAAFMTGLERNGDVVSLSSYAPLFARYGSTQWVPDLVWFDGSSVFGTPSYYVQAMFGANRSKESLPSHLEIDSSLFEMKSIRGSVGVGTWSTRVDYKDLRVLDGEGKVLLEPKFDKLTGWSRKSGSWAADEGVLSQASSSTDCRLTFNAGEGWSDYAFELKAMKTGGAEGMLILFGIRSANYYWWNLGGWGNTVSAIEKGTANARSAISGSVPMKIETDRWYDIKVVLSADLIRCYLDGKLIHELRDPQGYEPLYAHSGRAENAEIVVKLVNVDKAPRKVNIRLDGARLTENGEAIVLSGESGELANSLVSPDAVSPKRMRISGVSPDFVYTCEANSLTVLRLKER